MPKTALNLSHADLDSYDHIVVGFSGGKDSVACVLDILEQRPDLKDRIQLWHHDIDGVDHDRPQTADQHLFDWSITPAYCKAFAQALGLPLYFQWRDGGFEGEMLREDSSTAGIYFQTDEGVQYVAPQRPGKSCKCGYQYPNDAYMNERNQWTAKTTVCPQCETKRRGCSTRRVLPQVSADLQTRWCSGYLKIDVARRIINQLFNGTKDNPARVLLVTGERAQESGARAKYNEAEVVSESQKRIVHQWRPIHKWEEQQVWDIMKRNSINPHPCYHLGWGRASCLGCIFGNADQWASAQAINADQIGRIISYESEFGVTLKRKEDLTSVISKGSVYEQVITMTDVVAIARGTEYPVEDIIVEGEWTLPAGAFRECGGPV